MKVSLINGDMVYGRVWIHPTNPVLSFGQLVQLPINNWSDACGHIPTEFVGCGRCFIQTINMHTSILRVYTVKLYVKFVYNVCQSQSAADESSPI